LKLAIFVTVSFVSGAGDVRTLYRAPALAADHVVAFNRDGVFVRAVVVEEEDNRIVSPLKLLELRDEFADELVRDGFHVGGMDGMTSALHFPDLASVSSSLSDVAS